MRMMDAAQTHTTDSKSLDYGALFCHFLVKTEKNCVAILFTEQNKFKICEQRELRDLYGES